MKRGRWVKAHVEGTVIERNSQSCGGSKPEFKYQLCDLGQITHPL